MYTVIKRLVLGLTLLSMPALAQQHGHQMMRPDTARGMMQGGMMGQMGMMPMMQMMPRMMGMMQQGMMMQNPLHRATMMAFVLPAMADTLGLSEQQQRQLGELKQRMLQAHRARQQEIRQHQQALQALFQNEQQPDPAALREHLQAIARLEVDDRLAPYETFRQMLQVLNDAQRERLRGMQPHQLMAYMMRLPMMEMMPMMHMMHGREGMMRMMQGGMMPMMQMMQGGMPMHRQMEGQHGHDQDGHHHHRPR
ncbi:Spy/CpxP family protein refolding chaperone [Rhodothermus marinus]|uniref:DUF4175 domain-containing protein n=1 Tax=Rhodothermus marinus (strain ATCC 43812 / DSM 4252 / R-10) TaxID=518766 RepID=D0MIG0_RHOM4|nr:hypothetical protein [Rhodothermus marinus]ACY48268.1 hypothetical protein Rmar_1379 [Rhodothermus marinus DSM 4252]